jgi:hypothetical protein
MASGFYSAAWSTFRIEVLQFLIDFHRGQVDLDKINRSYIVLLPKKPSAVTVDAFRPNCLQNCSVKILAKILTSRLQQRDFSSDRPEPDI